MAMSYEDFLDIAKDAAKTRHPEADVTIQKVEKLQGESYVGLSVRPEGQNAAVTMNLHELHDQVVDNPKRLAAVTKARANHGADFCTTHRGWNTS